MRLGLGKRQIVWAIYPSSLLSGLISSNITSVSFPDHVDLCHQESTDLSGSERICERLIYMIQYLTCTCKNRSQRCLSENLYLLG